MYSNRKVTPVNIEWFAKDIVRGVKMIFRSFFKGNQARAKNEVSEGSLNERIVKVQSGDLSLRNQIIAEYQPFIIKVSSKVCKRYINPQQDDEFSIALSAFNEAIDSFDANQNTSFLTFADTVIRRRVIDHIRRESKYYNQIPMTTFDHMDEEENVVNLVEVNQAIDAYQHQQHAEDRKEEIQRYTAKIAEFGITLQDLVQASPKHLDARRNLFQIAEVLVSDPEMVEHLIANKTLPIKELLTKINFSRKTIERNRKYLIALAIIRIYDFHYLKDYLHVEDEERVER